MCLLMDDDDGTGSSGSNSGSAKLQLKRHHTWLIPRRVLTALLAVAIIFIILGMVLMAIGGGIASTVLRVIGGIMFGFGIVGVIVCLLVCLYAYFYYGTKDQAVQTEMIWTDEYMGDTPGYASIGRPSALKSAESTLRRNGNAGQKKVTMAPEVGPYGESPPHMSQGGLAVSAPGSQMRKSPSQGSGTLYWGEGHDPRGPGARTAVVGSEIGTGGIRITPKDRPFPSPEILEGYGTGQSHSASHGGVQSAYSASHGGGIQSAYAGGGSSQVIYSGGGSSTSSTIDPNYAYPKNVSMISGGTESGYSESIPGSQYSTLRSIPVTHIVSGDSQRQQQQQDSVEYARVNKQAKNVHTVTLNVDTPAQRGYLIQGQGFASQGQGQSQVQGQSGQFQQQRFVSEEDFDYDNPVERTPMIPAGKQSYHEQQMQYQRQQRSRQGTPDLYAPRTVNTYSLQRQTASSPYQYQQQQQHQHQQQQQQQQSHYNTYSSSSSRQMTHDDLPEPQPLVYPSARRPMTFEQVSSSKMSVYDNVLAGLKDKDEEE